jgi:hypothetical protein
LKLQPLLDTLRRLHQRGLTVGMVAAAFHRQRALPLTQHRLRLDEMTLEASLEGSRVTVQYRDFSGAPPRRAAHAGAHWGFDFPGVEGSLGARRGGRRARREKGQSWSFSERSYLVWGPVGGVRGAAPASPITLGSASGRSSSVGVRSQGTVDERKDPRPTSLGSAKILRYPVSPGSEEHSVDRRLNGRAVAGAAGWLGPTGV